jgi:3-dehydroquinate synthase
MPHCVCACYRQGGFGKLEAIEFMDLIERTIRVNWQHRVVFSDGIFDPGNKVLNDILRGGGGPGRVLIVLDGDLAVAQPGLAIAITSYFAAHKAELTLVHPPMICQGGEQSKAAWSSVAEIHDAINQHHIDRHSYLIAVGGGALLDMAGLAAATAHRGVRHVRIPTTTLSQCDSGVGVKNGINAFGKKNFIGTFAPPFAVINDFTLLGTLPERDARAGFVEAVKVACIRSREFLESLESNARALAQFEPEPVRQLIRRCAAQVRADIQLHPAAWRSRGDWRGAGCDLFPARGLAVRGERRAGPGPARNPRL